MDVLAHALWAGAAAMLVQRRWAVTPRAAAATVALAANVENLTLTGSAALSGTGNELNNVLTGNTGANTLFGGAGNDTINGGTGADSMQGGQGDDLYYVDNASDAIVELTGEGVDSVQTSIAYTLADQVENLTLTGSSGFTSVRTGRMLT